MIVSRKKSDGSPCETFVYSKSVTVTCLSRPDCSTSLIANPRFSEGAVAGGLNSGGACTGWNAISGEPIMVEGEPGSLDGWTVQISGNLDTADVLGPFEMTCVVDKTGTVSVRVKIIEKATSGLKDTLKTQVKAQPPGGGSNGCVGFACTELASIDLSPFDTGWVDIEFPYDLSNWVGPDTCKVPSSEISGLLLRLEVFVTNAIGSNQGGGATRSTIQIDNICVDGQLVSVKNPAGPISLRIFPNPNPGTFTVELPEPAKPGTSFRITDLTGRLVKEQKTEPGSAQQMVSAEALPAGLYFLQVVSEGKVLAIEKFVKQ
jgi:hypothetical protein